MSDSIERVITPAEALEMLKEIETLVLAVDKIAEATDELCGYSLGSIIQPMYSGAYVEAAKAHELYLVLATNPSSWADDVDTGSIDGLGSWLDRLAVVMMLAASIDPMKEVNWGRFSDIVPHFTSGAVNELENIIAAMKEGDK